MNDQRWRRQAACRGAGPALFYDTRPLAVHAAKQVCADCLVRADCSAHATAASEEYGVWGGLTADERPRTPRLHAGPGPSPRLSDDDLLEVFDTADTDRPAIDQLLESFYLPAATAYKYLARAERLGLVERRGRRLYPTHR